MIYLQSLYEFHFHIFYIQIETAHENREMEAHLLSVSFQSPIILVRNQHLSHLASKQEGPVVTLGAV